jgi:ketosteroid isomerase-like protein
MRNRTPICLAALLLVAVACAPPQDTSGGATTARTPQQMADDFEVLRAEWQARANAGDFLGVADFYGEESILTDIDGSMYEGQDVIAAYFEESFPAMTNLVIETMEVMGSGDMVAAYGTFSQDTTLPEGVMAMSGMWQLVCMYMPDGALKIIWHQNMFPAEMGSL